MADLKEKLVNTLGAHLPELSDEFNMTFKLCMPLWCDGKSQDTSGKKRKKTNDDEEEGGLGISKHTKWARNT